MRRPPAILTEHPDPTRPAPSCLVVESGARAIDIRPDVVAASDREVQAQFAGTAWTQCDSWYRDGEGRIVANWPGYMREYAERTRNLDPGEFSRLERRTWDLRASQPIEKRGLTSS
jgi:hypothetical protein